MRFGLLMTKLKMDANDVKVRDSAKIARLHRSDYSAYRVIGLLNCGFTSGLLQAAVFNPWDRALYLSVLHHRRFLHHDNFQEPMRGVLQTIVQKAISGGLYFPLEEIFSSCIHDYLDGGTYPLPVHGSGSISKYSSIFLGGMMAGAVNGLVLNPFSRIKVSMDQCYGYALQSSIYPSILCFYPIHNLVVLYVGKGSLRRGELLLHCEGDVSAGRLPAVLRGVGRYRVQGPAVRRSVRVLQASFPHYTLQQWFPIRFLHEDTRVHREHAIGVDRHHLV